MSNPRMTLNDVLHVARLSRLDLVEDELDSMRSDLDAILGYVAKLNELDVADVQPTTHAIPLEMPAREDVVVKTLTREEALGNAPKTEAGMFQVPTVIEGGN